MAVVRLHGRCGYAIRQASAAGRGSHHWPAIRGLSQHFQEWLSAVDLDLATQERRAVGRPEERTMQRAAAQKAAEEKRTEKTATAEKVARSEVAAWEAAASKAAKAAAEKAAAVNAAAENPAAEMAAVEQADRDVREYRYLDWTFQDGAEEKTTPDMAASGEEAFDIARPHCARQTMNKKTDEESAGSDRKLREQRKLMAQPTDTTAADSDDGSLEGVGDAVSIASTEPWTGREKKTADVLTEGRVRKRATRSTAKMPSGPQWNSNLISSSKQVATSLVKR